MVILFLGVWLWAWLGAWLWAWFMIAIKKIMAISNKIILVRYKNTVMNIIGLGEFIYLYNDISLVGRSMTNVY